MNSISAIILNQKLLAVDILYRPVKTYIEIALKDAGISDIHYVDDILSIPKDALLAENLVVIKDIAPEITEFDKLIEMHTSLGTDIAFFAMNDHSHHNGIVFDENDAPIAFGHSDDLMKIDIFITKTEKFVQSGYKLYENPFESFVEFVTIPETQVVNSLLDIIELNESFKMAINLQHINNGVYIFDPATTYISPDVLIEEDATIFPNTTLKGVTSIGRNAMIGPNTTIDTCVIFENVTVKNSEVFESVIDKNSTVGPFAYIRPGTQIGENVKIGDFVELKKAKIGNGTKISHLSYVGDALVGENVNIGCGVAVANYDGFNKFQTIIEDDAFIGCNTNLVAPALIEKGAYTAAGSTITKTVPANSLGIERAKQTNINDWAKNFRSINK